MGLRESASRRSHEAGPRFEGGGARRSAVRGERISKSRACALAHASHREASREFASIVRTQLLAECCAARRATIEEFVAPRPRTDARIHSVADKKASSRTSRTRPTLLFFAKKLLAALLNMCNAAGKFFAQSCWISKAEQRFAQRKKVFESLGVPERREIHRRATPDG